MFLSLLRCVCLQAAAEMIAALSKAEEGARARARLPYLDPLGAAPVLSAEASHTRGRGAPHAGRAALWAANAPEKLRKGYEYEEDRDVCAAMEATVRGWQTGSYPPTCTRQEQSTHPPTRRACATLVSLPAA